MTGKVSTQDKALLYIYEGRVKVHQHTVWGEGASSDYALILVQGSAPEPYRVQYASNGWTCNCPAQTECTHIVAAKYISPHRTPEKPSLGAPDNEIEALLMTLAEGNSKLDD